VIGTLLPTHRYSWRRAAWPAYVELLKRSDWPILVGPWRGEIGFEVLYWIPLIRWLMKAGIAKERIMPITRSGAGAWYGVPQGLELYALRDPQACRVETRLQFNQTGMIKQLDISPFDRDVLRDAAETLKLGRKYHVVHPVWMYHVLAHRPGGQPIGALERVAAKTAKAARGLMPRRAEAAA
jgi:hypothetical protein